MAEESTRRIYDIEINAPSALKTLTDLKLRSQELRQQQKELGEVTADNATEYYRLDAQIKAINAQAGKYQRQIQKTIEKQNAQEGSLAKLRAQLSLDTAEYVKLGNSEKDAVRKMVLEKRIRETSDALKQLESDLGDNRRNVGNYGDATKNLKVQLRELIEEMQALALAGKKGSKEYEDLANRAAALQDLQGDITAEVRNQASDTRGFDLASEAVDNLSNSASNLLLVLPQESDEARDLQNAMLGIAKVTTALNILTQIQNKLQKGTNTYIAAQTILRKLGIKQEQKAIAARAAHIAMLKAESTTTKVATAAQWLWNAALAANPVMLVTAAVVALVAGVYGLVRAFSASNKAARESAKALKELEKESERHDVAQSERENRTRRATAEQETENDRRLENLKKRHATEQEIEQEQLDGQRKLTNITLVDLNQQIEADTKLLAKKDAHIKAQRAQLALMTRDTKKRREFVKALNDEINERRDLQTAIVENTEKMNQERIAQEAREREAAENAAERAYDIAIESSRNIQEARETAYRIKHIGQRDDIKTSLAYERDLFEIQQQGELERLRLQYKNRKITKAQYDAALAAQTRSTNEFYAKQTQSLNSYYKDAQKSILSLAGRSAETEVAELIRSYSEAKKQLDDLQAPVRLKGQTDEEYRQELEAYEKIQMEKAELAVLLEQRLQRQLAQVKKNALREQASDADELINEEYAKQLSDAQNNERKRLHLEREVLEKQIAERKKIGADTYEQEAQLRANIASERELDYNKEIIEAGQNAKKVFEAKKAYLLEQRIAAGDNADEILRIDQELHDAELDLYDARTQAVQTYTSNALSALQSIDTLMTNLEQGQTQRIEKEYDKQADALQKKLDKGLISQAQYDRQSEQMEKDKDKKLAEIERKQAIRSRALSIFQVAIDTAQSIMESAKIGFPQAIPFVAMSTALGALQTAAILAEPLPKAARGKYIQGPAHSAGGVKLEAEGGETIINKRSSSMFLPLLSAINQAGGGVPFTRPGDDGGYAMRSFGASGSAGLVDAMRAAFEETKIVATIEDIRREDKKYINIEKAGRY